MITENYKGLVRHVYNHGGSRIYYENEIDRLRVDRFLIADTYSLQIIADEAWNRIKEMWDSGVLSESILKEDKYRPEA